MNTLLKNLIALLRRTWRTDDRPSPSSLAAEQLEPRILYSAAPVEAPTDGGQAEAPVAESPSAAPVAAPAPVAQTATPVEAPAEAALTVPLADSQVADRQQLNLVDVGAEVAALNQEVVETLAAEARQRWIDSGISAQQIAALDAIDYQIADVGGAHLGVANGSTVTIDDDAGGTGVGNWFIDATPGLDEEFSVGTTSAATGRFDLLSTLIHEQGHVLGLSDQFGAARSDVMDGLLDAGTRRLPVEGQAQEAVAGSLEGAQFLTANIQRVSTNSVAGQATGGDSSNPSVSADGRYVVFESQADNLVTDDTNNIRDIFLKDLQTGEITRVNTDASGAQASGGSSSDASISANGKIVVFKSSANNLVVGDTNNQNDIFVKDLTTGSIERLNLDINGNEITEGALDPGISGDGRFVVFGSIAPDLVAGDTNSQYDVFRVDRDTGVVIRVSTTSAGAQANGYNSDAFISADGMHVAFSSDASNLVVGDTNDRSDIFVKNVATGETRRANTDSTGGQTVGGARSYNASISKHGRYVSFDSNAVTLVAGDTNGGNRDIFVKDMLTGAIVIASADSTGAQGTDHSERASISADGRYVAFESEADDLVSGDTNGLIDVFVKDLFSGNLVRVSTDVLGGESTGGDSGHVAIAADGKSVAFRSDATNLVPGDSNGNTDVFFKSLGAFAGGTEITVAVDDAGVLHVIGGAGDERLTLKRDGADLVIKDSRHEIVNVAVGATQVSAKEVRIAFAGLTGLTIRGGGGDDRIIVDDFGNLLSGNLTIDGEAGVDRVIQKGTINLVGSNSFNYVSERIDLKPRSVLTTDSGDINLHGNEGTNGAGRFTAINAIRATLSTFDGEVNLLGTGGDKGGGNRGVVLRNTDVSSSTGNINITGTGGGTTNGNEGIRILGGTAIMTGGAGTLMLSGNGGNGRSSNTGLFVNNARFETTGNGTLDILGYGHGTGSVNSGVVLKRATAKVSGDATLEISGEGSDDATGGRNRGTVIQSSILTNETGRLVVNGQGGTGTNANEGLRMIGTTIAGNEEVQLYGGGDQRTSRNGNRGMFLSRVEVTSVDFMRMTSEGGGGVSSNSAATVKHSNFTSESGILFSASADDDTSGKRNIGIDLNNVDLSAATSLSITGSGGTGTDGNIGIKIRRGNMTTQSGEIQILGEASENTSGSENYGLDISKAQIESAGDLGMEGTGGGGFDRNQGVRIVGGNYAAEAVNGTVGIFGIARSATLGAMNVGSYLVNGVQLSGDVIEIEGNGGGGTGSNHGTFMNGNIFAPGAQASGNAGAGTDSENTAGDFFP